VLVVSGLSASYSAGADITFTVSVVGPTANPVVPPAGTTLTISMGTDPTNATLVGVTSNSTLGGVNGNVYTFGAGTSPQLDLTGAYTLLVSAPGFATTVTPPFTITPETTTRTIVFTTEPPAAPLTVTSSNVGSAQLTAAVAIVDKFGNVDASTTYNGDVIEIQVNNSGAQAPFTTAGTIASGRATLTGNLYVLKSGVASLTASDTTGGHPITPSNGTSTSFTVVAGAESQLVFTAATPGPITAGLAFPEALIVAVEDAQGNVVTTASDTITMSAAAGPGALSGVTTVGAINGYARFQDLILSTAGAGYELEAQAAAAPPAATPEIGPFTCNTNTGYKLVISGLAAGSSFTSNQAIPFTVTAVDASGNTVNTPVAGLTVTLSLGTDPTQTGPGLFGVQEVALGGGISAVFPFNGPMIHKAGNGFTILASAPGYATVATPLFNVTGDSTAGQLQLAFTTEPPSTVTASSVGNFGAAVQIQDKWGNPINEAGTQIAVAPSRPAVARRSTSPDSCSTRRPGPTS
jgi:hypothetical protein